VQNLVEQLNGGFGSPVFKYFLNYVFIFWFQIHERAPCMWEKIEPYTSGVWSKAHNVGNVNGRTSRHIGKTKLKLVYVQYGWFF